MTWARRHVLCLEAGLLWLGGCAAALEEAAPPSAEMLYSEGLEELEDELYPEALKLFGDVKTKFPYSKYAALADLRVADSHFMRGKLVEAVEAYRSFLKFHPGHADADYAMFMIGESYFDQIPEDWWFLPPGAEKDQANTRLAISAYADMLARFPKSPLAPTARERQAAARRKLADHEMYVARFYFDRQEYAAAASRAEGLLQSYPGLGLDPEALWLVGQARLQQGDTERALQALQRLAQEFPITPEGAKAGELLHDMPAPNAVEPRAPEDHRDG